MESSLTRFLKIKRSKKTLNLLFEQRKTTILVHYSCESFVDNTKGSHKITSIAARNFDTAQTHSFSVFQVAEELKIQDIPNNSDRIERRLLEDFFEFAKKRKDYNWVHWNMRDINYGFPALEHRLKVLGGRPYSIPDECKFDLARILYERFGKSYSPHPKLQNLSSLNNITNYNFLTGQEEAEAFKNGDYLKLHQSTLRKVDTFDCILAKIEENDLKVASSFFQIYGLDKEGIFKALKDHWLMSAAAVLVLILTIYLRLSQIFSGAN